MSVFHRSFAVSLLLFSILSPLSPSLSPGLTYYCIHLSPAQRNPNPSPSELPSSHPPPPNKEKKNRSTTTKKRKENTVYSTRPPLPRYIFFLGGEGREDRRCECSEKQSNNKQCYRRPHVSYSTTTPPSTPPPEYSDPTQLPSTPLHHSETKKPQQKNSGPAQHITRPTRPTLRQHPTTFSPLPPLPPSSLAKLLKQNSSATRRNGRLFCQIF